MIKTPHVKPTRIVFKVYSRAKKNIIIQIMILIFLISSIIDTIYVNHAEHSASEQQTLYQLNHMLLHQNQCLDMLLGYSRISGSLAANMQDRTSRPKNSYIERFSH